MARKALRKQRAWQKFCRDQVANGLINQANGSWARAEDKWTDRHMIAGYRLGSSKRKVRTKASQAEVEG